MTVYEKACRYASLICKNSYDGTTYKDIIHQAWVGYFDGNGGANLFDEPIHFILKVIKLTWYAHLKSHYFFWRKNRYHKHYVKMPGTGYEEDVYDDQRNVFDSRLYNSRTPLDETCSNDFLLVLDQMIANYRTNSSHGMDPKILQEYIKLVKEGWRVVDIAEKMGTTMPNVSRYKNKIKILISKMEKNPDLLNSPFNGNKLKTPKKNKITRKHYEENKDKYNDYVWDTDRWADHNEFYTQLVHKEKEEGLIIIEGNKLDQ